MDKDIKYENARIELILFTSHDIVTASGGSGADYEGTYDKNAWT